MNRSYLYNIIHLSISFVLIFLSYFVAQTFQTSSDYAKDGAFAIGIIYIVFCLSNLALSQNITQLLGLRITFIVSSLTYILFIAANIKYIKWVLYISAFLVGLGAALIWTAQGAYVAIATNKYEQANNLEPSSRLGFTNGMFFSIYSCSLVFGNLLASFLFHRKYDEWIIFTVMSAIAGLGSFSLIFVRPVTIPKQTKQNSILSSLSILFDIPFLLLIPVMCYLGLSEGFIYGSIPPLIFDKSQKFLIFTIYGTVNAFSSIIFGKLSDKLVRRLIIYAIGGLSYMIIFVLLLTIWKPPLDQTRFEIFVMLVTGLAIGESIFLSQVCSTLAVFYGQTRPTDAFACLRIFQAGCTAIGFFTQPYVSFRIQIFCLIILLTLSLIILIYEHYCVISLDTGKTMISMSEENKTRIEIESAIPLTTSSDIK
ncbi:unnamed protein product [Adineta steineri]|uniref:Uncharacterized protein n=1 Tax=Adineta steineri TaxID=433720 RepID=A0A818GTM8_9BILA|nr:unnamed protein product [Adineta steineri]CAF3494931.1 unnamed protein product [Adineta steineri]CAF3845339.1 unnamed protein product [Adineta steineri]